MLASIKTCINYQKTFQFDPMSCERTVRMIPLQYSKDTVIISTIPLK